MKRLRIEGYSPDLPKLFEKIDSERTGASIDFIADVEVDDFFNDNFTEIHISNQYIELEYDFAFEEELGA